ncbi:hypothetical protein M407DRAFT_11295 [Tulasnella calospora MUT 4182]|uniref:Uncharacterized protein n=1 Tax=Tulasnella calospora MUT 4182 TaxID=1051891 RepID=A0A0C3PX37_9AGAM|nr:hypothetical protein M407DRAFT_11295 [Tulasnella calospora MUT 4182]
MALQRDQPLLNKRRQRQRDEDQSENASLGRALVRVRQMWGSAREPISKAFELPVGDSEKEREAHNYNLKLYEWMTGRSLSLEAQLNVETDDPWKVVKRIAKEIDAGRAEARNSDTAALKRGIASNFDVLHHENEFGGWNPQLNVKQRNVSWGLHHPQLAPLLTPIGMDWENEDNRSTLLSPGGIVDPLCWYPFMYEGQTVDSEDLKQGLFRGDLLVKAMNYVLHRRPDMQHGSRNVAAILGVTEVNVELIAYIVTLVKSLSHMEHEWLEDLLEWWNNQIFPEQPKRRANIFPGNTFAQIQNQVRGERSPETFEPPHADLDGAEMGPGRRSNKQRSTETPSGRELLNATANKKKRNATTAGLEGRAAGSGDEDESEGETVPARRTTSAKLARLKLVVPEEEESESESENERVPARGEQRDPDEEDDEEPVGTGKQGRNAQKTRDVSTRRSPMTLGRSVNAAAKPSRSQRTAVTGNARK